MIASYYTQITLTRLTELLDLSPDAAERTLCKLVTDKTVRAKIDRPAGIVDFKQKQTADQTLNEWSGDLGKMLGLIEKTSHLINKVGTGEATPAMAGTHLALAGICHSRCARGRTRIDRSLYRPPPIRIDSISQSIEGHGHLNGPALDTPPFLQSFAFQKVWRAVETVSQRIGSSKIRICDQAFIVSVSLWLLCRLHRCPYSFDFLLSKRST